MSTSNTTVESHLAEIQLTEKENVEKLKLLQKQIVKKSLEAFQKANPQPELPSPPSTQGLVVKNILYEGNMTWDEAERSYDISRASISRIINKEKRKLDGESEPARPQKKELVTKVEENYTIQTSTSAMDRALAQLDISWKNTLAIPTNWNTEDTIRKRMEFIGALGPLFLRPIVYIDESGFNMHTKKSKGRALKGEPAKLTLVPKGKRINLLAALSREGFIHHRLVESLGNKKRGTNAEDFRNFLIDLFPKLPRGAVIIMDNCKIHHASNLEGTWLMAKSTYGIDKLFLPPYSPFLNPIEYGFNALKAAVQATHFSNRGELRQAIEEKLQTSVTAEKAEGFYRKSAKYYPQCTLGLPFQGKPLDPEIPSQDEQVNNLPMLENGRSSM